LRHEPARQKKRPAGRFYFGQHLEHVPLEKSSCLQHHWLEPHVTAAVRVLPIAVAFSGRHIGLDGLASLTRPQEALDDRLAMIQPCAFVPSPANDWPFEKRAAAKAQTAISLAPILLAIFIPPVLEKLKIDRVNATSDNDMKCDRSGEVQRNDRKGQRH
jgi:hypothetical protein